MFKFVSSTYVFERIYVLKKTYYLLNTEFYG